LKGPGRTAAALTGVGGSVSLYQHELTMKLIIAYIQPDRLNAVKEALFKSEVFKMSVVPNAMGCGQQKGYTEAYRGQITEINLRMKTRLEIAVNDNFVKPTVDAIIAGARTGKIGDGKIFVVPLEECIRIRTGETGRDAIG
jgi:nitrogen regulatory protein P-II 2